MILKVSFNFKALYSSLAACLNPSACGCFVRVCHKAGGGGNWLRWLRWLIPAENAE